MIVVAYMDFFNNEMQMKKVDADCWKDALLQCEDFFDKEGVEVLVGAETLEEAKDLAFDWDCMFCIMEV